MMNITNQLDTTGFTNNLLSSSGVMGIKDEAGKVNPSGFDLVNLSRVPGDDRPFPTMETYSASLNINKCDRPKNSITGNAIQTERDQLRNLLMKAGIESAKDFVCYIPNSRLPWFNKCIKQAISTGSGLSKCDIDYINNFWMNNDAKRKMMAIVSNMYNKNTEGFTVDPPRTRQGFELACIDGKVKGKMRNPGYVGADGSFTEYNPSSCNTTAMALYRPQQQSQNKHDCECSDAKQLTERDLLKYFKQYYEEKNFDFDDGETPFYNRYSKNDSAFFKHLRLLGEHLHGDTWDLNFIMTLSEKLRDEKDKQANMYLLTLINPWLKLQVGVPTAGYAPTAKFQISNKYTFSTNASGNCAWAMNPFFLTFGNTNTQFGFNNNVALVGSAASNFFLGIAIGQALPIALYQRYRVVSAGLNVKYVGSALNASGYVTQAVDYGQNITGIAVGTAIPGFQQYGQFSTVDNCYFVQTTANNNTNVSNTVVWAPDDFAAQNFQDIGMSYNDAPLLIGYCSGGQASAPVIELSIAINIEAIVSNQYTDYLPSTIYKGNYDDTKEAQQFMSIVGSNPGPSFETLSQTVDATNLPIIASEVINNGTVEAPSIKDIFVGGGPIGRITKSTKGGRKGQTPDGVNFVPKMQTDRMRNESKQSVWQHVINYLDWITNIIPGWKYTKALAQGKNFMEETGELAEKVAKVLGVLGVAI